MCLPSFPGHPINGMGSGNEVSVTLLPTYSIALADMIHTQNKTAGTINISCQGNWPHLATSSCHIFVDVDVILNVLK